VDPRPPLLRLRLRGKIEHPRTPDAVTLVGRGHALERGEALVLAPDGRRAADAEFRLDGDEHAAASDAYQQFLTRNAELIRVCHDWQLRRGDWKVVGRLLAIDERTGPVIRRLGTRAPHFDGYRPRLRDARTRVEEGDQDWFTSPRIDSYHTVWMELHEHLLLAIGLDRGDESGGDTP
jgi:hypothetical protein